jgi:hypothetical protein
MIIFSISSENALDIYWCESVYAVLVVILTYMRRVVRDASRGHLAIEILDRSATLLSDIVQIVIRKYFDTRVRRRCTPCQCIGSDLLFEGSLHNLKELMQHVT